MVELFKYITEKFIDSNVLLNNDEQKCRTKKKRIFLQNKFQDFGKDQR